MELLLVLTIIGLLAGLGTPALVRARQRGSSIHCLNNLRQLGLALRLYAEDHEGRLPAFESYPQPEPMGFRLRQTLGTGTPEVFRCRADRIGFFDRTGSSYDWNLSLNGKLLHGSRAKSRSGGESEDALLSDHEPWHGHRNGVFTDGHTGRLLH